MKVSFKQFSDFVDASDKELEEGVISNLFKGKDAQPKELTPQEKKKIADLEAAKKKLEMTRAAAWQRARQQAGAPEDSARKKQAQDRGGLPGVFAHYDWSETALSLRLTEGQMSRINLELNDMMDQLSSDNDLYDMINDADDKRLSKDARNFLLSRMDEIAADNGLHPDDDYDKIFDKMMDELQKEYESV